MYDAQLPDMLLTVKDVAELLFVGRRTVWRWSRKGRLPRPIKLSARAVRWRASAIQAYIDRLTAARAIGFLSEVPVNS